MPVSIVANLSSQYAQSAIKAKGAAATIDTQRLSSGSRVFKASEDPASIAIGNILSIENAAISKARINAAGGVSMLQIADGALGTIGDIAIRMKALATQASSGHLSDSDRAVVDSEFQSLKNEIGRIAGDTEFNGVHMLAGTQAYDLVGGNSYTTDGIATLTVDSSVLSGDATFRYSYNSTSEQLTLTRIDQGTPSSQTFDITALLDNLAGTSQNLATGQTMKIHFNGLGASLTLDSAFDRTADILPTVTDNSGPDITLTSPTFTPTTSNIAVDEIQFIRGLSNTFYSVATGEITLPINSSGAGGTVTLGGLAGIKYAVNGGAIGADGAATGDLVGAGTFVDVYVTTTAGEQVVGRLNLGTIAAPVGGTDGNIVVNIGQGIIGADDTGNATSSTLSYMIGSGVLPGEDIIDVVVPSITINGLSLTTTDVLTKAGADSAITTLDNVLTTVNQTRANIGAQQARLEFVGRNLASAEENNETARSALIDVDVPKSVSDLAEDQAMLQVGVSMLSQANKLPQIVLQLLQNA